MKALEAGLEVWDIADKFEVTEEAVSMQKEYYRI
jgi:hypothetical protein